MHDLQNKIKLLETVIKSQTELLFEQAELIRGLTRERDEAIRDLKIGSEQWNQRRTHNKSKFSEELIKEYGEQVYRDNKSNKNGLESNSYSSSEVAAACGLIEEKDKEKFRKIILKYAQTTKFDKTFI